MLKILLKIKVMLKIGILNLGSIMKIRATAFNVWKYWL